jgi:hypothetical protein
MSTEQRDAWLEALLLSEGGWSDGKIAYYQNAGELADAIELAVCLSGHRPARGERFRQGRIAVQITETASYVGGPSRRAYQNEAAPREIWCPTTELGSWTARSEDGGIFLTGNSDGTPVSKAGGQSSGPQFIVNGNIVLREGLTAAWMLQELDYRLRVAAQQGYYGVPPKTA